MTAPASTGIHVQVLQENLTKGIAIVERALPSRYTLPITANVYVGSDRGRLKLAATDLDTAIVCWVGAKIDAEGATTVPGKQFGDIVRSLPPVTVDLTLSGGSLRIQGGRGDCDMPTLPADDFPRIPDFEPGWQVEIPAQDLHRYLSRTVLAAATDDSRPVLNGVAWFATKEDTRFAAADGFRLTEQIINLPAEPVTFILPRMSVARLLPILAKSHELVEVSLNPGHTQARFALTDIEFTTQLTQGTYPHYPQLIPQTRETRITFNRAAFSAALNTAAVYAREGTGVVRLRTIENGLVVSALADQLGAGEVQVDAEIEGPENKIAFNARYIREAIEAIDSERMTLDLTNSSAQGVFRPVDDDSLTHVVMPMFVQW